MCRLLPTKHFGCCKSIILNSSVCPMLIYNFAGVSMFLNLRICLTCLKMRGWIRQKKLFENLYLVNFLTQCNGFGLLAVSNPRIHAVNQSITLDDGPNFNANFDFFFFLYLKYQAWNLNRGDCVGLWQQATQIPMQPYPSFSLIYVCLCMFNLHIVLY